MTDFESNRLWANEVLEKIENCNSDDIVEYFQNIEQTWRWDNLELKDVSSILQHILNIFKIDDINIIDINYIDLEQKKIYWELSGVYKKFKKMCNINENDYQLRWDKIFEKFYYSEKFLKNIYLLNRIKLENYDYSMNEDPSYLYKFVPIDYEKNSSYHNLLLYIIEELNNSDLARYNDTLYKKIRTKEGYETYAWEPEQKIKKWIMEKCSRKVKFDQWKNMNSGQNIKQTVDYLMECPPDELPVLEKDRHIFSFKNGLYITKINKGTETEPIWGTLFLRYGKEAQESPYLNTQSVSSKYFNEDFNDFPELNESEWFNIIKHCPNFKKILDYQEFPDEVQKMLCVFMGKCAFDIGEIENWQAIMYLLGMAGAGKSTVLTKILQKWYEEEDVGIIPNNIEKQYGLKPHINKKMVLAPEMQGDCKLEQTDWQLIVEGGKNSFAEKYKNAESEYWKVPMAMAGNSLIKYNNQGDQTSRRTVVFNFWKKVMDSDTLLEKKLEKEIPIIMKLCITAYLHTVNTNAGKGIWKILPPYFHEQKDEMEQTTNGLKNFLKSGKVVLDEDKYIPEKIFKQAFNDHCRENNIPKQSWNADYYANTFSVLKIHVKKNLRRKYPPIYGENVYGTYFLGVDLVDENNLSDTDDVG